MSTTPINLLVLGSGEIARLLVQLAQHATYTITVCDEHVDQHHWPESVSLRPVNFSDQAWSLTGHTHAIIARGHKGDAENLQSLLEHGAQRVYLIASAHRSQSVIEQVTALLSTPDLLHHLSAPAGLNLGGQSSYEIAQSILAEVQWRNHGQQAIQPLNNLRQQRLSKPVTGQRDIACPGKRP